MRRCARFRTEYRARARRVDGGERECPGNWTVCRSHVLRRVQTLPKGTLKPLSLLAEPGSLRVDDAIDRPVRQPASSQRVRRRFVRWRDCEYDRDERRCRVVGEEYEYEYEYGYGYRVKRNRCAFEFWRFRARAWGL